MDFSLSSEQQAIVDSIKSLMDTFGDEFWLPKIATGKLASEEPTDGLRPREPDPLDR